MKRILSSVLVIVMLIAGVLTAFPFSVAAAESSNGVVTTYPEEKLTDDEKQAVIDDYQKKTFESAKKMYDYDLDNDYLATLTYEGGKFMLAVNIYTGVVYHIDNTDPANPIIYTSNPYDKDTKTYDLMSQVAITYVTQAQPSDEKNKTEYSFSGIKSGLYLDVQWEKNSNGQIIGIRSNYKLGAPEQIYRVPDAIFADDLGEYLLKPMLEELARMLEEAFAAVGESFTTTPSKVSSLKHSRYKLNGKTYYIQSFNLWDDNGTTNRNRESLKYGGSYHKDTVQIATKALQKYAEEILGRRSEDYKAISSYISKINTLMSEYSLYNESLIDAANKDKTLEIWLKSVPNAKNPDGSFKPVFVLDNPNSDNLQNSYVLIGKTIKDNFASFPEAERFDQQDAEELARKTGFVSLLRDIPEFSCSLVYTLDKEDGSLLVDFPITSLKYDRETFIVKSVNYFRYYGAGNVDKDGSIFYPDGSGSVIEFSDFGKSNIAVSGDVYGKDYGRVALSLAYKHREQISMPVYGMVSTLGDGSSGGYFAIIEDGAALSSISASIQRSIHVFASAYSEFTPLGYDKVDLSDVVSVGNSVEYIVVAETGYQGSHKTRFIQLTDPAKASAGRFNASYIGMAECYRSYLEQRGAISKIQETEDSMPLYIESLGSMDVLERILTFPVSVSTPLTTFEDIKVMYSELSAKGITNINFRLTGFSNGGMYYTYPAKVNWESSLGGDEGFVDLISFASKESAKDGFNLGIYPDFDFQYINNTAMFDRVSNRAHGSRYIDNRYANKQVYDSVSRMYEVVYSILVSADTLDELYTDFVEDYFGYGNKNISVSTLGSDLNSNFDDDNTVDRETSRKYVESLLNRMAKKNGFNVMTDIGNAYTYKYVDHILNATLDSSHLTTSSYPVPFLGMVLHGYKNYAGTPLNYTGSIDYNILKSIENGASLYYILCMQNTNYLKDDEILSKYYGVDYKNWFGKLVDSYNVLNEAIGDIQTYKIVDHRALIGERVPNPSERVEDLSDLLSEFASVLDSEIAKAVYAKLDQLKASGVLGTPLSVKLSKDEILSAVIGSEATASVVDGVIEILSYEDLLSSGFISLVDSIISKYESLYPDVDGAVELDFDINSIDYKSRFNYSTESEADSDDYSSTVYTSDNGSIIMVKYQDAATGDFRIFIINYNNYDVTVNYMGNSYLVGKVGFVKI